MLADILNEAALASNFCDCAVMSAGAGLANSSVLLVAVVVILIIYGLVQAFFAFKNKRNCPGCGKEMLEQLKTGGAPRDCYEYWKCDTCNRKYTWFDLNVPKTFYACHGFQCSGKVWHTIQKTHGSEMVMMGMANPRAARGFVCASCGAIFCERCYFGGHRKCERCGSTQSHEVLVYC